MVHTISGILISLSVFHHGDQCQFPYFTLSFIALTPQYSNRGNSCSSLWFRHCIPQCHILYTGCMQLQK